MLPGDAVEPTLDPAFEDKVVGVDGQNPSGVDDPVVKPFREGDRQLDRPAVFILLVAPFLDPVECPALRASLAANVGFD